ncbi:MAG TPA: glucose 1-dehydrogenase [Mycobacteriales bacterium]|nr:glucose 1-dehydrogenase [Mycobacteriales bacterium]
MSVLDTFSLVGRVAIVTGASSGLGVTFARVLAEAGADVVLAARRAERLADAHAQVEAVGRRALSVRTDVTDTQDCAALVAAAVDAFGRVDVLVNNAGVADATPATKQDPDEFRGVLDVNLNGCYWMARECAQVMPRGSSIINVASVLGMRTLRLPQAGYSSSKAALIGLTRDLSAQWAGRKGIRVNALAPGIFPSDMSDEFLPETIEQMCAETPMGRIGESHELSGALIFLASEASSYVTGITLPVDGGWIAP